MAYVSLPQLSGMSNLFQVPTIPEAMLRLTVGQREGALLPGVVRALKTAFMPFIQPTIRPAVMPAIQPTIRPVIVTQPSQKEAAIARVRIDPISQKEAAITRARIDPVLQKVAAITRARIEAIPRAPSGATHESTTVTIVPGAYMHPERINTGARLPMVGGRGMSIKESEPIVTVAPSAQGITLVDVTSPELPPTFVEAAAVEPSPILKYAMLAIGGYILYDSFVKSKPKKRRRRR